MPIYEFQCSDKTCEMVITEFHSINACPEWTKCTNCGAVANKIISKSFINTGAGKARVYHQYKGDPNTCPADLKEALKYQDKPKGLPEFSHEAMPVVTRGQKQDGRHDFFG